MTGFWVMLAITLASPVWGGLLYGGLMRLLGDGRHGR